MTKTFKNKVAMIDSVNESDRNSKMFFLFPVHESGACNFVVFDKNNKFFDNIKSFFKKDFLHEIFLDGIKRKPYLDIEHIYSSKEEFRTDSKRLFKQLTEDIIKVFSTVYKKKISTKDILFLNSSGEIDDKFKLSVHVIISPKDVTYYYINSKFNTKNSAYHLYSCLININNEYKNYIDEQVYKINPSLRMIGSAKYPSVTRVLVPFDSVTFKPLDLSNKQKLEYLISYVDETKTTCLLETPIIEQTTVEKSSIIYNSPTRTDCSKKLLEMVKKYHPTAEHRNFSNGFYDFNYTNRNEPCPITGTIHTGTAGFYCFETNTGFYLKCRSSKCNKEKIHIGYIDEADGFIDSAHQINQKYLLEDPKIPNILDKWINNDKTLCIKSAMGTGKTTLIKHLLDKHKFKKILWITHRQTLTKSLYGSFKKYGFINYMDTNGNLYCKDRVIIQVDSLNRIISEDPFEGCIKYNKYDLVIIDEIEGCLSHYNSPFLNKIETCARDIFNNMTKIISHSKKLLLLDADIGVRTMLFAENFGKVITINNTYQPIKKIFNIINDGTKFNSDLFLDINLGKNICVVSMSSRQIEKISHELTNNNVKFVMHISKSDDKLKDELEDVNSFWKQHQVVLYSPTITSGVDFNEKHFDKIYCIIKSGMKVCDQRSFLQMVGRIRHIKEQKILCWYDKIPVVKNNDTYSPIITSPVYTYQDLLSYYRYYETLNGKKLLHEVKYETIDDGDVVKEVRKEIDITLYDKINLHNDVENLNKHSDIFLSILHRLITKSGHEILFDLHFKSNKTGKKQPNKSKKQKEIGPKELEIEQLITIDLSKYKIPELIQKQSSNKLNEIEKLVLKKHFFMKDLGLNSKIKDKKLRELLNEYLDDRTAIRRYEILFGYHKEIKKDNIFNEKEKAKIAIIIDLVNRLIGKKYTKLTDNIFKNGSKQHIIIENKQYNKAISDIIDNSIYFKDEEKNRALFYSRPGRFKPATDKESRIAYAKRIQNLLNSYNINLKSFERKSKNGKRGFTYSLCVDEQIRDIVRNKYKSSLAIDDKHMKMLCNDYGN